MVAYGEGQHMTIEYITDSSTAAERVATICTEPVLGIDIETTGLDPYRDRIRLVQVATRDGRAYVFDLNRVALVTLVPIKHRPLVAHNASFEWRFLRQAGFYPGTFHDTQLLGRLVHFKDHIKLADLSELELGQPLDKTLQTSDWAGELSREQIEYAAQDAITTARLLDSLLPQVDRSGQRPIYRLWCRALPVLAELTLNGMAFDWDEHSLLCLELEIQQDRLKQQLTRHLGGINFNSGPQLGQWLQENLSKTALAKWPKTPKERLKTDIDTLKQFGRMQAVEPLLAYKKVTKLLTTYGRKYQRYRHPVTGRMHPDFLLGATRSGRIVARNPNAQNPPREDFFRRLFVPSGPDRCFVGADFSQIELRVAALLSNDQAMLAAYRNGEDLHRKTAAAIAGVAPEQVTKEQRQAAKAVNFGNLYGQGPKGLVRTAAVDYGVTLTLEQAKNALDRFSTAYPQLAQWQRQQVAHASVYWKTKTRLGLLRDFCYQGTGYMQGEAQNIPVQGSAAEVLLSALVVLPEALSGIDARLYHNVHDELLLDVSVHDVQAASDALQRAMVTGYRNVFPEGEDSLNGLVEVKTGRNWAEVH